MTYVAHDESAFVPPVEVEEAELYHPKTFIGKYIWSQDAKVIAVQYSITAIAVGLVALVLSGIMRLQLGFPNTFSFITPSTYLQFVTMHGMIMVIYLLTALFLGGFGNYLIPLMVGARDMVFPYVNMVSYWVYLFAVLLLMASFFVPGGPTGAGWTLYPPQAILSGTPGANWGIILMLVSLAFFIIGFTMGGLNYVVTVLQARTRGMTMMRLPLTIWGIFMATILALLAFPALFVSAIMMTLDHLLGTSFFMPAIVAQGQPLAHNGGSPVLFQHLFWFFGHPEVYIVALPAFGIVSDLISVNARRNIFGYRMMVWAILAIGGLSFIVWAHHMYVSGMNPYFGFFFATTTLIIAVPTALKVYNWVLTLWRGDIHLTVPMLFAIGFVFTFVNGGSDGPVPGKRARGSPAVRHHVRGRPFPHGDGGVTDLGGVRGDLSLVPQGHRAGCLTTRWANSTSGSRSSEPMPFTIRCITSGYWACRAGTMRSRIRTSFPSRRTRLNAGIYDRSVDRGRRPAGVPVQPVRSYFKGKPSGGNPWRATTLEWQTPDTPPKHGNFGPTLPVVYRWAYDYSVPGAAEDFIPQNQPPAARAAGAIGSAVVTYALLFLSAIMAVVVWWLARHHAECGSLEGADAGLKSLAATVS